MLAHSVIAALVLASAVYGQDYGYTTFDDKAQCINYFVDWCNNMTYPQEGAGMTMISISYVDSTGVKRVFCTSDFDGTNCTKSGSPWFSCTSDNKMFYKGQLLSKDSANVVDDICSAAEKAFTELFVQNLSYDNTTLKREMEKGMESFFQQIADMQDQILAIQDMLKNIPMYRDPWFGGDFPFGRRGWTTDSPSITQLSTDASNQIEKE